MPYFAVIDTETNWVDQVMSIGTVIADAGTFRPVAAKYNILPAYCEVGGMYYDALFLKTPVKPICCTRQAAMKDLLTWCNQYGVPTMPDSIRTICRNWELCSGMLLCVWQPIVNTT